MATSPLDLDGRRSSSRPKSGGSAWWQTPGKPVPFNKFLVGLQFGSSRSQHKDKATGTSPLKRNLTESYGANDHHCDEGPVALSVENNAKRKRAETSNSTPLKKRKTQDQAAAASLRDVSDAGRHKDTGLERDKPNFNTTTPKQQVLHAQQPIDAPAQVQLSRETTGITGSIVNAGKEQQEHQQQEPAVQRKRVRLKKDPIAVSSHVGPVAAASRPRRATAQLALLRLHGDSAAAPPDLFAVRSNTHVPVHSVATRPKQGHQAKQSKVRSSNRNESYTQAQQPQRPIPKSKPKSSKTRKGKIAEVVVLDDDQVLCVTTSDLKQDSDKPAARTKPKKRHYQPPEDSQATHANQACNAITIIEDITSPLDQKTAHDNVHANNSLLAIPADGPKHISTVHTQEAIRLDCDSDRELQQHQQPLLQQDPQQDLQQQQEREQPHTSSQKAQQQQLPPAQLHGDSHEPHQQQHQQDSIVNEPGYKVRKQAVGHEQNTPEAAARVIVIDNSPAQDMLQCSELSHQVAAASHAGSAKRTPHKQLGKKSLLSRAGKPQVTPMTAAKQQRAALARRRMSLGPEADEYDIDEDEDGCAAEQQANQGLQQMDLAEQQQHCLQKHVHGEQILATDDVHITAGHMQQGVRGADVHYEDIRQVVHDIDPALMATPEHLQNPLGSPLYACGLPSSGNRSAQQKRSYSPHQRAHHQQQRQHQQYDETCHMQVHEAGELDMVEATPHDDDLDNVQYEEHDHEHVVDSQDHDQEATVVGESSHWPEHDLQQHQQQPPVTAKRKQSSLILLPPPPPSSTTAQNTQHSNYLAPGMQQRQNPQGTGMRPGNEKRGSGQSSTTQVLPMHPPPPVPRDRLAAFRGQQQTQANGALRGTPNGYSAPALKPGLRMLPPAGSRPAGHVPGLRKPAMQHPSFAQQPSAHAQNAAQPYSSEATQTSYGTSMMRPQSLLQKASQSLSASMPKPRSTATRSQAVEGWSQEQIYALQRACQQCDVTDSRFWTLVADRVPGKTAGECHTYMYRGCKTPEEKAALPRPRRLAIVNPGVQDAGSGAEDEDVDDVGDNETSPVRSFVQTSKGGLQPGKKPSKAATMTWVRNQHTENLLSRLAQQSSLSNTELHQAMAKKQQQDRFNTSFFRQVKGWSNWQRTAKEGHDRRLRAEIESLTYGAASSDHHQTNSGIIGAVQAVMREEQELVDNLEDDEYYQDEYFDQDFECE